MMVMVWPCTAVRHLGWRGRLLLVLVLGMALTPWAGAQPAPSATSTVTFRQAIDLALTHSAGMGLALADQIKARESYLESRNTFIPQVTLG